ncbi:uncharacterized protein K444DRAFT_610761 [Hyaloscypha bicolor E]|uniref:Uncharacterized protein n=1 Tax=Hyaloscypha bicolor E TaxID=1095630 RepID=A0A2J6TI96_9HELO|nr:uncharacterized protein K444DRAFT_610761 [Hyaloscypha bicolor E]PMD62742.1 hypothetical protein K444DRAFT_610761 [Hyaloscypha bicolor E]
MPLAGRISVSRLVPGFLKKYVLICSSGGGALGTVLGSVVGAIGANLQNQEKPILTWRIREAQEA